MVDRRPGYVVLAGGVGAARFLRGLVEVVPPEQVTVVVNTGDDYELWGLHVSPDLDINLYTLADAIHPQRGWGLAGDTFNVLRAMERYTDQTWFQLGDRDLATQLFRSQRLRAGSTLTAVTGELVAQWGLRLTLLPMSDDKIATHIDTPDGAMHFQEYLVKRGAKDRILGVRYIGAEAARPAPGVLEAIRAARAILLPPSNPVVSIGTIMAVPGVREALEARAAPCVAVSPIIGGRTVKGPADRMLQAAGFQVSPAGVARFYGDLLDGFVIDDADAAMVADLMSSRRRVVAMDTLMTSTAKAVRVARMTVELAEACRGEP